MGAIALTGIDDFSIGNFVEVNFAQGPASAVSPPLKAIILANKTSAGSGTVDTAIYGPDTTVQCDTESDVIAIAGTGSEAHRMWRRFRKVNKDTALYLILVTESVGSAATGTITIATTATGPGTLRVYICDEFCDASINKSDAPTAIGDAVVAAINAHTDWPVTAANASGTITLTAKQKGLRGNWLRYGAQILTPGNASIGTTVTPAPMSFMTGGTTADSSTAALATLKGKKFYYVISAAEDATQLGALLSQVNTDSQPANDNPQRVYGGSVDTISNANTIATGLNGALAEIAWLKNADVPPCELAAHNAGVVAFKENPFTVDSLNMNGFGSGDGDPWAVPAPRDGSAPTPAQLKQAIQNGLTPYAVNGVKTYMHKRVTTRTLNGSTADYRAWAGHIPSVCHQLKFSIQQRAGQVLKGKAIGDDPKPGERFTSTVVTPSSYFNLVVRPALEDFGDRELLEDVPTIKLNTKVQREQTPRTRISCRIPTTVRDILDSTATAIDQQPSGA